MMTRWFELTDPCYHHHSLLPVTPRLSPLPFLTSFEEDDLLDVDFALDLLTPKPVNAFSDLIRVERTPSSSSYTRVLHRALPGPELWLEELSDRVSALEARFDRVINHSKAVERKYTWSAEIKGEPERKYKWTAEIKGASCVDGAVKRKEKLLSRIDDQVERKYKWTAEIEGKGDRAARKYTVEVQSGGEHSESKKKEKETKSGKEKKNATRIVEIEDEPSPDHGTLVLRQAFAKRAAVARKNKGKMKQLSPPDAASLIQMSFRAYLIRRSQALRALRELAIAKSKLKELRALFNNFSYRRQIARDPEERQRFSEKIIVLLLTVDAIEGADIMVRAAKRSMVDELEAMLDVVDPQPAGKSASMKRRTFDMPDGVVRKEIAESVAQVVQMLDNDAGTFEACV